MPLWFLIGTRTAVRLAETEDVSTTSLQSIMTLKASSIDIETAIVCCVAQYRSPSSGNRREFKRLDLTPYVVQTRSSGYTSLLGGRQALSPDF